jgi:hypothetical protein
MKHLEETKGLLDNSALFYVVSIDMDGCYSYVNDNYARIFLHINGNLVGQPSHITMHIDDVNTCIEVGTKCFENPTQLFPATIRKHDGNNGYIYTQWEYKAMFDEEKNPVGLYCVGYNITKYVAEELDLKSAYEKIDKNSTVMEQIIFQQSHLIRAPLSNIIGLTSLLDRTLLDTNTSNICDMILESSNQLDDVIKSIIKIARA